MAEMMTARFQFRLTPTLLQAVECEATKRGVTPQHVVREAVSRAVLGKRDGGQEQDATDAK